jgi:hypothetical protein
MPMSLTDSPTDATGGIMVENSHSTQTFSQVVFAEVQAKLRRECGFKKS